MQDCPPPHVAKRYTGTLEHRRVTGQVHTVKARLKSSHNIQMLLSESADRWNFVFLFVQQGADCKIIKNRPVVQGTLNLVSAPGAYETIAG